MAVTVYRGAQTVGTVSYHKYLNTAASYGATDGASHDREQYRPGDVIVISTQVLSPLTPFPPPPPSPWLLGTGSETRFKLWLL